MTKAQKVTFKRYAISSAVTFFTGFCMVMYSNIDDITMNSFKDGTVWGVLFTATRFGVKGLLELYLSKQK